MASGLLGNGSFGPGPADSAAGACPNPDPCAVAMDQPERALLLRELEAARAAAEGWRALHAQLHAYCVDQLLPAQS